MNEFETRAAQILARRKASVASRLDDAALSAARSRPVIMNKIVGNVLHGIVDQLSGASQNANQAGGYYDAALGKLLDSGGSPAARQFAGEEKASLQPMFDQQDQELAAKEAAMGITNSGAAKNDYSNLKADQSRALAGAVAPLYSSAIGAYGNIAGAGAGGQAGAYQNSLDNFYNAVRTAAGAPSFTQSTQTQQPMIFSDGASTAAPNYNPYSMTAPPTEQVPNYLVP